MIAELFLACALQVPLTSAWRPVYTGDLNVFKMLRSFWEQQYHDDGRRNEPWVLIYNPYRDAVAPILRLAGLRALDMSPLPGLSEYAIQGQLEASPIRHDSIHILWDTERVDDAWQLHALKIMVAPMGFLMVQLDADWMTANMQMGWQRFPFEWRGFRIYRKMPSRSSA